MHYLVKYHPIIERVFKMKKTALSLVMIALLSSACSNQVATDNSVQANNQTQAQQPATPEIAAVNKLIAEIEPQIAGDKCQLGEFVEELKNENDQKELLDYLKQFALDKNDACLALKFSAEMEKLPESEQDKLATAVSDSCQRGNIKACHIVATSAFLTNKKPEGLAILDESCKHGDKAVCEVVQEKIAAMKKYVDKTKLYQTVLEMERHTSLIDEEHNANQEVKLVCNDSGYIEAGCFPDTSEFFAAKSVRITPGVKDLAADFELRATLTAGTLNGGQIVMKRHKEKWSCIIEKKNSQIDKDYLPDGKNCTLVP